MLDSQHRGSEQILKRHCDISFMMGRHTWIVSKDDIVFVNIVLKIQQHRKRDQLDHVETAQQ